MNERRTTNILLLIIAIPVVFYVLKLLSFIFVPLVFSMFIALMFWPLMRWLRKKKVPKIISLLIVVLIIGVFFKLTGEVIQLSSKEILASLSRGCFIFRRVAVTTAQPPETRAHLLLRVQILTWPENVTRFVKRRLSIEKSNSVPLIPIVAVGLRIFYAAMSYLVLRAKNSPAYMGTVQLDTDEGWNKVMADFENIFDDLIAFQEHLAISKQRLADKDTAN